MLHQTGQVQTKKPATTKCVVITYDALMRLNVTKL